MSDAVDATYAAYVALEEIPAQATQEAQREDAAFAKAKQDIAQSREQTARDFESNRQAARQRQRAEVDAIEDRFAKIKTTAGGFGASPARDAMPSGGAPDFEIAESLVGHMGALNAGKQQFARHLQQLRERAEGEKGQSAEKQRDVITWVIAAVGLVLAPIAGSTLIGVGIVALTALLVVMRFSSGPSALVRKMSSATPALNFDRRRRGGFGLFVGGIVAAAGGVLVVAMSSAGPGLGAMVPVLQPIPFIGFGVIAAGVVMIVIGRRQWSGR